MLDISDYLFLIKVFTKIYSNNNIDKSYILICKINKCRCFKTTYISKDYIFLFH